MNRSIQALHNIAQKETKTILGLMSGTSLDGLDIACCGISGAGFNTQVNLRHFITVPYNDLFRDEVKKIFAKPMVDFAQLTLLNGWIAGEHARMINDTLQQWKMSASSIDLIASHGQTVFHAPKHFHNNPMFGNATLQIGDGDLLAVDTGIITISDFRQKHIAYGGEGAPLAAYGDLLLFASGEQDVILINIGGIANFSIIKNDTILSTDCGPGNTIMDAYMQANVPGSKYDQSGAMAARGHVNDRLLQSLLDNPFFSADLPLSSGPELFNLSYLADAQQRSGTSDLSQEDTMATLNRFTAECISRAIIRLGYRYGSTQVYPSGGGAHNHTLMETLHTLLPGMQWRNINEKGFDGDAKEAVLFALLANEAVAGDPAIFQPYDLPACNFGKISFPA